MSTSAHVNHMDDQQRAVRTNFGMTLDDLEDLVEGYRQRTYNEDLQRIEKFGGVHGIAERLHTNLETGLRPGDFSDREEAFGSNYKEPQKRTPFCILFYGALQDFMLKLLIVCALISLAFDLGFAEEGEYATAWIEGAAILLAVFVVSFIGSLNDYQKEEQFLKLQAISEKENIATLIRDGKEEKVHFNYVQTGDIMRIRGGDNIPVDGLLLRGSGVTANESAMTGEPDELKKENPEVCKEKQEEKDAENQYSKDPHKTPHDIPSPILLSGTEAATGDGWFLVLVVGKRSCQGKIMAKLETRIETTPLQEKLEAIGADVGKMGMYTAILTIHVLFLRFFIERFMHRELDLFGGGEDVGVFENKDGAIKVYLQEWIEYFIIGITIIVVAVPEGLPLAVMISLAYSVKKMLIDQNFVKRLSSCEIMGGANNICSDKTGTLTKNQMTVTCVWAGRNVDIKVTEQKYNWSDYFINERHFQLFSQALSLNTIGTVQESSATEMSMLIMMQRFGVVVEEMRAKHLPGEFVRFHFTSKRKRMSTIMEKCGTTEHGYDKRIHIKGASEIVLESCTHYLTQDGERRELKDEMLQNIKNTIYSYAKGALRTISFAYKDLKPNEGGPLHDEMDENQVIHAIEKTGYTLIAIVGIKDIIREEVPEAVQKCQRAGITVRMVTGDNKTTATAIAQECHILAPGQSEQDTDAIMEGPEFFIRVGGLICNNCKKKSPCNCGPNEVDEGVGNMPAFKQIWKTLKVLARSRPEDKYLLVTGLKQLGDIVAVTGDGTNDAPALKKADVGFAMGITGTDVAKHAADIIVMDDNFASIVKACMWGRNIYDNIRKFLQFQLTVNVVALVTAFVGACILIQSPLFPIQLLWVNLIMDSLASLALATEYPKESLLNRPPYKRDEYIISRKMVKHLLGQAVYQIIVLYAIVFAGEHFYPEPDPTWRFERAAKNNYLYPGRLYDWDGTSLYILKQAEYGPSRHMTNVFNVFVVIQIFNMINAKKINDELNIFSGFFKNPLFLIVYFSIIGGQILIVEFTNIVFEVSYGGLPLVHWGIAVGLGSISWVVAFMLKFIPDTVCPQFGKKQKNPMEDEDHSVLSLRKKRTQSFSLRNPGSINKEGSGRQHSLH